MLLISLPSLSLDALRIAACIAGIWVVYYFFKSIIRLGILNQRYQDPLAFWVGRLVLHLFQFRIRAIPGGMAKRHEIMVWYWPIALIGIIVSWFLLVTLGFALMNWAIRADATFPNAIVSSGSALSTLGFSTPSSFSGQILAIVEGAIGLFLIVYLFTFLPGFMQLIHERGSRVAWIYARTGSFLDALALLNTTVEKEQLSSEICFDLGVTAIKNVHLAMRGTPISPERSPALMHVKRMEYDIACEQLVSAGFALKSDRELAWTHFIQAHMQYEEEVAWLAAAISDPTPFWPTTHASESHAFFPKTL